MEDRFLEELDNNFTIKGHHDPESLGTTNIKASVNKTVKLVLFQILTVLFFI